MNTQRPTENCCVAIAFMIILWDWERETDSKINSFGRIRSWWGWRRWYRTTTREKQDHISTNYIVRKKCPIVKRKTVSPSPTHPRSHFIHARPSFTHTHPSNIKKAPLPKLENKTARTLTQPERLVWISFEQFIRIYPVGTRFPRGIPSLSSFCRDKLLEPKTEVSIQKKEKRKRKRPVDHVDSSL